MAEFIVKAKVTRIIEMLVTASHEDDIWNNDYDELIREIELETTAMEILSVERK